MSTTSNGPSALKIILIIVGGMGLLGFCGCVGCLTLVGVGGVAIEAKQEKDAKEAASGTRPSLAINADQLFSAYNENRISADNKYKDKLVKVSGQVKEINKGITGKTYITLQVSSNMPMSGIHCYFNDSYNAKVAEIRKGNNVTIVGECEGYQGFGVELSNCAFAN